MKRVIRADSNSTYNWPEEFMGNKQMIKYGAEDRIKILKNAEKLADHIETTLSSSKGPNIDVNYSSSSSGKTLQYIVTFSYDKYPSSYATIPVNLADLLDIEKFYLKLHRSANYRKANNIKNWFFQRNKLAAMIKSDQLTEIFKHTYSIPGEISIYKPNTYVEWDTPTKYYEGLVSVHIAFDISDYWNRNSKFVHAYRLRFTYYLDRMYDNVLAEVSSIDDLVAGLSKSFDPGAVVNNLCDALDIIDSRLIEGVQLDLRGYGDYLRITRKDPDQSYHDLAYIEWKDIAKSPNVILDEIQEVLV